MVDSLRKTSKVNFCSTATFCLTHQTVFLFRDIFFWPWMWLLGNSFFFLDYHFVITFFIRRPTLFSCFSPLTKLFSPLRIARAFDESTPRTKKREKQIRSWFPGIFRKRCSWTHFIGLLGCFELQFLQLGSWGRWFGCWGWHAAEVGIKLSISFFFAFQQLKSCRVAEILPRGKQAIKTECVPDSLIW